MADRPEGPSGKIYGTKPLLSDAAVFEMLETERSEPDADPGPPAKQAFVELPDKGLERMIATFPVEMESTKADPLTYYARVIEGHRGRQQDPFSPSERAPATGYRGFCIWLTGAAGTVKSTFLTLLEANLRARKLPLEILDEKLFGRDIPSVPEADVRRKAVAADLLSRNGIPVIAVATSLSGESRDAIRAIMEDRFVEVFVKVPLETSDSFDVHDVYTYAGEFGALTDVSGYETSEGEAAIVWSAEEEAVEDSVQRVLKYLVAHDLLPAEQGEFVFG